MIKPTTDSGSGEHIVIRGGPVPRIDSTAEDSFVQHLDLTTVAVNLAYWTEELQMLDRRKRELQHQIDELMRSNLRPIERHLIRLHARLNELTPAMESLS